MSKHSYSNTDKDAVYRVIRERRDMRHFTPAPVAPDVLHRILTAAHNAPSVGYMQPWRFIRITDDLLKSRMAELVEQERIATAEALNQRQDEFMRLKVEGMKECGELIVVALMDKREAHIFGRRTLPDMDLASVSCAIQNMWLAARAEGLGMGWVSLFDPEQLADLLRMPEGSEPVAILCLGHVKEFYPQPMLATENWAQKQELSTLMMENSWECTEE